MRLARQFMVILLAAQVIVPLLEEAIIAADDTNADLRYLLVRRAGSPEKNYYELSRTAQFLEPQLFSDEFFRKYRPVPGALELDIITDSTVRYGVYQAWKVRVINSTDSVKAPTSPKYSVYVLTYPRNRDWKFCAKKYDVASSSAGGRTVVYTDFQSGKEQVIKLSPEWPRPWQIYEIEILNVNALVEIWQASKHLER